MAARYFSLIISFYFLFCITPSLSQIGVIEVNPRICKEANGYFSFTTFTCLSCPSGSIVDANGQKCICPATSKYSKFHGGDQVSCSLCPSKQVSHDGWSCASSPIPTCWKGNKLLRCSQSGAVVSPMCDNCLSKVSPARTQECSICSNSVGVGKTCTCTHIEGNTCFSSAISKSPDYKYTSVDARISISSYYIRTFLDVAHHKCLTVHDVSSCEFVANFCVATLYRDIASASISSSPCQKYRTIPIIRPAVITKERRPWLYYLNSVSQVTIPSTISFQYKTLTSHSASKLVIEALTYSYQGEYEGLRVIDPSEWQLCNASITKSSRAFSFGTNYASKCKISAKHFFDYPGYSEKFYSPYISYNIGVTPNLYPIPVLFLQYVQGGLYINRNEEFSIFRILTEVGALLQSSWVFTRRFFLIDRKTGINVNDGENGRPQFVRVATSLVLTITLQKGNRVGRIYPPMLTVNYTDVALADYNTDKQFDVSFEVLYRMDQSDNSRNLIIAIGSLLALMVFFTIFQSWNWSKRSGRIGIDCGSILKFLILLCGYAANGCFIVLFLASLYWLILYKNQSDVSFMVFSSSQESSFVYALVASFVLKFFDIIHLLIVQTSADVFFINWERPHCDQQGTQRQASVWRVFLIANEWNELQVKRKISFVFQLFAVVLVLYIFGVEEVSRADPIGIVETPNVDTYRSAYSRMFRFAIGSLVYVCVASLQWLFFTFLWERFVAHDLRQFVDLCSMANVSVITFENAQFGYYIHGRSPHGSADADLKEMHQQLKREENDLVGRRGLVGDSDQQTFMIAITKELRYKYDGIIIPLYDKTTVPASRRSGPGDLPMKNIPGFDNVQDKRINAYYLLNKFFVKFFNNGMKDMPFICKKKNFSEVVLGTEFVEPTTNTILYDDGGYSFESLLLYGWEASLCIFDLLTFSVVDLIATNFVLAAIVTYFIATLVVFIRGGAGRRNIARKTLIDEKFLI